jgi:single-stranded DNA-binding protein
LEVEAREAAMYQQITLIGNLGRDPEMRVRRFTN